MKLSQAGEFGIIELIRQRCGRQNRRVILGIGDDAAAIRTDARKLTLLTTDALIEDIHFKLDYFTLYQLGWRALTANLSDIAAMGGQPVCAVVTLGLNRRISVENALELYEGILALGRRFNCSIAGGDLVKSPKALVISISVLGEAEKKRITTRSGARAGDFICVTGDLGQAQAGLELLSAKNRSIPVSLTRKHLLPVPRLKESDYLLKNFRPSAMIDISDGLAADLHHICEESKTGAVLFAEKIPVSRKAMQAAGLLNKNAFDYALQGGEEYELLFTLNPAQAKRLAKLTKFKVSVIGRILPRKKGIWLEKEGKGFKLKPTGYTHF